MKKTRIPLTILSIAVLTACNTKPAGEPSKATPTEAAVEASPTATAMEVAAEAQPDDCTLPREAIKGALDTGAKSVAKVLSGSYNEKDRHYTESVKLQNGITLTYSMGGCHHFAYGFTFEDVPAAGAADVKAYARLARTLIEEAPVKEKEGILPRALEKVEAKTPEMIQHSDPPTWTLECGDANCDLAVAKTGDTLKISASYDFPI